jgi:predicted nucleic acid-binding Zn ribbon protein
MHYLRRRDLSTDRERTHAYMRVALLVLALVILWAVIIAAAVTIYTTLF